MKKILALVLTLLMIVGVTAALADTYTVLSPSKENVVTGHTYKAYQILTAGSYNADKEEFGDLDWVSDDMKALLDDPANTYKDAQAFAETLGDDDSDEALALAQKVLNSTAKGAGVDVANGSTLDMGLWLIVDVSDAEDVKVINMANLFVSTGSNTVTIISKVDAPSSEKKVKDKNDTSGELSELQDSADYDIGDDVPYTLFATLPGNYDDYDTYYLKFFDDMSKGLTYNGDAKIFFGDDDDEGDDITLATLDGTIYPNGQLYGYEIADLKTAQPGLTGGTRIRIEYTAKLNANAVIGAAGNPNKYRIEYSNNPNDEGDGDHGTTPWDINIVFTYKTIFNKVDGDNQPLTGADFELFKKVGSEWVNVTLLNGEGEVNPVKTGDTSGTTFSFAGLDDGDYKLVETATPSGYNSIDPIEFTITADHTLVSDNPTLNDLTGTDGAEFVMEKDVPAGELEKDITNLSGTTLPSTGGMGTTILYIGGSILVLAAVILLVTKRRMKVED